MKMLFMQVKNYKELSKEVKAIFKKLGVKYSTSLAAEINECETEKEFISESMTPLSDEEFQEQITII